MLNTPETALLVLRWLIFFSLGEAGSSEMAESTLDRGSVTTSADMIGTRESIVITLKALMAQ